MPATWADVSSRTGFKGYSTRAVGPAIEAGAYYMAMLRRGWSSPRPSIDRHELAEASYNAGMGNLVKAQKVCGMPVLYTEISACLPCVTGQNAQETLTYVQRIRHWREELGP